ncbi:unnamed protein product [Nippostrongylus brasiliensis]|uniref:Methyltransf_21 domain-containing protein n=1 Tax=Nippostrongylus brasiliensis TaxID=27835 RepID=A0A0N4YAV2_NIPBR|nr:unnamed protein product [Nippostrongylus brasiliensis]
MRQRKGATIAVMVVVVLCLVILYNSSTTQEQVSQSVIVTVGIGKDTKAEEALSKTFVDQVLPNDTLFYGADPILDVNKELYSKIGTFLPFAVSGHTGISQARVLEPELFRFADTYVERTVIHIDLVTVLNEIINKKFYDALWIDNEWSEYEMLPFFYRDGRLDQNNITICQMNMEASHSYLLSISHSQCVSKYIVNGEVTLTGKP